MVDWSDEYLLGDDKIDAQHKSLFDVTNEILELKNSSGKLNNQKIKELLYFLQEYTNKHFIYEEDYMQTIGYPELENHKKSHQDLLNRITKIAQTSHQIDKLESRLTLAINILLTKHILNEDKKIKDFKTSLKNL